MQRRIIHVDMDQFFAAVEQRDHPELRGLPIAVGHDAQRGVVSTASYEARRFGVHSAQSIQVAKRLCPQLVIVEPHYQAYKAVSMQINEIMHDYTDLIEPLSLDEAFLDVTENKRGMALAVDIAREKGIKAGLIKLRFIRPFPAERIAKALVGKKAFAVIDRSVEPLHDDVIVAYVNGEFTIKYLDLSHKEEGYIELRPANQNFKPIRIDADDNFEVWGVVVWTIKKWKR
jgi:hypothetical protein